MQVLSKTSCVLTRLHLIDLTITVMQVRFRGLLQLWSGVSANNMNSALRRSRAVSHWCLATFHIKALIVLNKQSQLWLNGMKMLTPEKGQELLEQMSGSSTSLRRQHRWVTCLFMKSFYSWNKIGFAKPARIFGTWTEIISPIISGKLTLVGSDWACTNRSNVNWWSFFTVWKRSRREHEDGRG